MPRAKLRELLSVNTYWLGLSFMWNSLHVIVLPAVLLLFVDDARKNTVLGLLTFVGLMVALVVQPLSGAVSDAWASRFGRRRLWIVLGTLLDLGFLWMMATASNFATLAVGYVGLQFTSNVAHGPAQGLMHDRVPPEQMGMASGIKNFFDMAGMIVSSLAVGRLLAPENPDARGVIALIAAILLGGLAVTVFGVREQSTQAEPGGPSMRSRLAASLRTDVHGNLDYWRLIFSRLLFLVGVYGIQAFAQYYIRDTLPSSNPVQLTGDLMAAIAIALVAFSVLGGYLCDRFGRKPMHAAAAVLVAAGSLLMLTARTAGGVLVFGGITGAGIGLYITANWALANDLAPRGEAGKFLGLTNLATAGASAISRLTGPGIDALNAARPGQFLGYSALFAGGALLALLSLLWLRQVPDLQRGAAAASSPSAAIPD
jgi:MFS family permease